MEEQLTHQFSFCVSGAMARSTFCFSGRTSAWCSEARDARRVRSELNAQRSLTEVIDVEDSADGAARSTMLDLALRRRCGGVINGRIDLAEGLGGNVCRHGWKGWVVGWMVGWRGGRT